MNALKFDFTSGFSELGEVCLGVGLIFADQCLRERNVFNEALIHGFGKGQGGFAFLFTQGVNDRQCNVIELLSLTGTAVVDAGNGFIQTEEVHIDDIVHVNEVTHLGTVCIA